MSATEDTPLLGNGHPRNVGSVDAHDAHDARDTQGPSRSRNPPHLPTETESPQTVSIAELWEMMPVLIFGIVLMTADAAVEYASYAQIGSSFNQFRHISWLAISYIISVTITQPLYSRLSDMYGRKSLLLCSYIVFGVGIIFCILSFNFWVLVVARGVVGIGSGGMGYMVTLILTDITNLHDRALWQVLVELSTLLGQALGGILGGSLVDALGWRKAFMVEIIPPFLLVLAASRLVRLPELRTQQTHSDPADTWHDNLRSGKFDVTGLLVLALGLIAPVIYLQLAGSNICCNSSAVYVLFAVSIAPLATFVWIELKVARAPLVPVKVLFTGEVMSIMGTMFFSAAVTAALMFVVPYYINISGRGTATKGGIMNTIFKAGSTSGWFVTGLFIRKIRKPWYALVAGAVLALVSSAWVMVRWTNSEKTWENIVPISLSGMASAAITSTLYILLLVVTKEEDRAIMYGVFHIFINTAGMLAVACISATIEYRFGKHLRLNLGSDFSGDIDEIRRKCMESVHCLDNFPRGIRESIQEAFVQAVGDSFYFISAAAVWTLIFAFMVKKHYINDVNKELGSCRTS